MDTTTGPKNKIRTSPRFSKRLKKWRTEIGLSQGQLARKADISRQAISLIEAGGGVSLDVAVRLAKALEIPLEEMVGR